MFGQSTLSITVTLVVAFCFVDLRSFGSTADDLNSNREYLHHGSSPWCVDEKHPGYNLTNMYCCEEEYRCGWYIKPGSSGDGLHNDGIHTRHKCECAEMFYDCNKAGRILPPQILEVKAYTCLDVCAKRNDVTKQLEWVKSTQWLSDCSIFNQPIKAATKSPKSV